MPDERSGPSAIPVAGTLLLLRTAAFGLEVLMTRRPERGSFAGAWVFPGGKVEPADAGPDEEAAARSAAVRETREETGLVVAGADLVAVSRWVPPQGIPRRIRTWFFATGAPEGEVEPAPGEVVDWQWMGPAQALHRHAEGAFALYPPTWITLHSLVPFAGAAAALDALRGRDAEVFETALRETSSGQMLLWRPDGEYDGATVDSAARHRLETGTLPWRYTRTP